MNIFKETLLQTSSEDLSTFDEAKKQFASVLLDILSDELRSNGRTNEMEGDILQCVSKLIDPTLTQEGNPRGEYSLKGPLPKAFNYYDSSRIKSFNKINEFDCFQIIKQQDKDLYEKLYEITFQAHNLKSTFVSEISSLFPNYKMNFGAKVQITETSIKNPVSLWKVSSFIRMLTKYCYGDEDKKTMVFTNLSQTKQSIIEAQAAALVIDLKKLKQEKLFQVKDLLRGTIYVSAPQEIEENIKTLSQKYEILEIKNRLRDEEAAYAAIYVIFAFKGLLTELQLVVTEKHQQTNKDILKHKICHTLYELQRSGDQGIIAVLAQKT